jgi:hypothetical protein
MAKAVEASATAPASAAPVFLVDLVMRGASAS